MPDPATEFQALLRIARLAGVESQTLFDWVREELVLPSSQGWDEATLEQVQRIRRLSELGLNAEGIEVALHMREAILQLRAEIAALQQQLHELQRQHERQLAQLIREIAFEVDRSS